MSKKDPSAGSMYGGSLYQSMRAFSKGKKKAVKPAEKEPEAKREKEQTEEPRNAHLSRRTLAAIPGTFGQPQRQHVSRGGERVHRRTGNR